MDLLKTSFKYARQTHGFYLALLVYFLDDVILGLINADLYYKLSLGDTHVIFWIVFIQVSKPPINALILRKLDRYLGLEIKKQVISDAYHKYDRLDHLSKSKFSVHQFGPKKENHSSAIYHVIEWGMPNSFYLLGTFISTVYTFWLMNLLSELLIMATITILVYNYIIRPKQNQFSRTQKSIYKENNRLLSLLRIMQIGFQQKEISPDRMTDIDFQGDHNHDQITGHYQKIMMITHSLNNLGMLLVAFMMHGTASSFMLVFMTLNRLNGGINGLTHFLNQFSRYQSQFDLYNSSWKNLVFKQQTVNLPIPQELAIIDVKIDFKAFSVRLASHTAPISLAKGSKILIRGKTGAGKTTFVNGIVGKISGVVMNHGQPENYAWLIADMYQNIREKMPSSDVSIRYFFRNEVDDNLILECLRLCFEPDELTRLQRTLETQDIDHDDLETGPKVDNWLDADLNDILSGGQKTRLCLATRVYEMRNKEILVLDEPEQGSDKETVTWVLGNIFTRFSEKTIIVISHMCDCQLNQLHVQWSTRLLVNNGVVSNF